MKDDVGNARCGLKTRCLSLLEAYRRKMLLPPHVGHQNDTLSCRARTSARLSGTQETRGNKTLQSSEAQRGELRLTGVGRVDTGCLYREKQSNIAKVRTKPREQPSEVAKPEDRAEHRTLGVLPAHGGQRAHPSPLRHRQRLPSPTRPTPPHPHTREEGRCAHPSARATPAQPHVPRPARVRKRTDGASSPTPPTDTRRGTVRPPCRAGHASPAARTRKGEGRRVHPLRTGYASPAFMHAAMPALPRGCKRVGAPSPAPSARGVLPQPSRVTHAGPEKRGYTGRGAMQPERERRAELHEGCAGEAEWGATRVGDPRTNGRVRKGESDGEGVVNEAKRSRGEAARANGRHPPRQ
ncbi:hypothetical protein EDB84DRAFT_1443391 [Lactarius hengduanensis]|nr:hypothetical protein EDB84DRAFT_1443391 [Lactarius hengduanensis]